MSGLRLSKGQMRIMQILWRKQRATAQEITDAINVIEPVRHSTVQTFLRVLVRKKIISFDVDKRTFVYFPLADKENVTREALHNFINTTFSGSLEGMISYILKYEDIIPEQLKEIKKLIDEENES
jgi:BlaI family transcriptional regulator, penicillinase repressor